MPSSTSHSESRLPRTALLLAVTALVAVATAVGYSLRLNPEVRFYTRGLEIKRAWAGTLRAAHSNIVVVAGASTTAFSVDGERMLQRHGLPVVNMGLHAGMEASFLVGASSDLLKRGDRLVLELDPVLLAEPFSSPDVAAQLGVAVGRPDWIHATHVTGEPVHWVANIVSLRPGAYHAFTLLGKAILRKPLYRYRVEDIHTSGWQQTAVREPFIEDPPPAKGLAGDARRLLLATKRWCDTNGVEICYSLVWRYSSDEGRAEFQRRNIRYLREILEIMPVLKDAELGAHARKDHFADVGAHLNADGAASRTDALAGELKARAYWSLAELEALEQQKR